MRSISRVSFQTVYCAALALGLAACGGRSLPSDLWLSGPPSLRGALDGRALIIDIAGEARGWVYANRTDLRMQVLFEDPERVEVSGVRYAFAADDGDWPTSGRLQLSSGALPDTPRALGLVAWTAPSSGAAPALLVCRRGATTVDYFATLAFDRLARTIGDGQETFSFAECAVEDDARALYAFAIPVDAAAGAATYRFRLAAHVAIP
jgi:hypothetical protein